MAKEKLNLVKAEKIGPEVEAANTVEIPKAPALLFNLGEIEKIKALNKFQVIRLEHYLTAQKISRDMTVEEWDKIIKNL
ncbi:MAG TPA: hypothetical protein VHO03_16950 [Ignavibacteriales bacterium]|nr:hypothetical protein [Ignavibacteriales bacterium]